MIDDFLRRYAQCESRKDLFQLQKWADERMTPLESATLRSRAEAADPELRKWLRRFDALPGIRRREPQGYRAEELAPGILTFSAGGPAQRSEKALLLAFATLMHGMLVPTAWFLQYLAAEHYDVVFLQDHKAAHFAQGISPYADSLPALMRDLDQDLGFGDYRALYCVGFSMGGFPALRAGVLAGARRAVAIGGRLPWHIKRLTDGRGRTIPAFDPLCDCVPLTATDLVCVYGADFAVDCDHAERLARAHPVRRIALPGGASHNPVYELARAGLLQDFLDTMFDIAGGEGAPEFMPEAFAGAASAAR